MQTQNTTYSVMTNVYVGYSRISVMGTQNKTITRANILGGNIPLTNKSLKYK